MMSQNSENEEPDPMQPCVDLEQLIQAGLSGHHLSQSFYTRHAKRIIDLVLTALALIATFPIILAAWIAVKITSRGPGFFLQQRVGLDGKLFPCCKLRSMYLDHSKLVDMEELKKGEEQGLLLKVEDDPRVTPIGHVIRRTSIDELPQLFNVLRGEMSLVGPRPLMPHMVAPFPRTAELRHEVLPGITGLWQVSSRSNNTSMGGMIKDDLRYVETISLRTDLHILLTTIPAVFKGEGAH